MEAGNTKYSITKYFSENETVSSTIFFFYLVRSGVLVLRNLIQLFDVQQTFFVGVEMENLYKAAI